MEEVTYQPQEETIGPSPKLKVLKDALNGEELKWTPEEEVRQIFINKLIKEYKYPRQLIKKEVSVRTGQTETKKRADIVVYRDDKNFEPETNAHIIVETKKKDRSDGVDQLETYLNVTTAEFGVWFNGKEYAYIQQTREPHKHFDIPDIPPYGKSLADVGLYQKKDLIPATDLKSVFEAAHNYIYANEGYLKEQVFNEVLKLIFVKMVDEKSASSDCQFRITEKELRDVEEGRSRDFKERIENLFGKVKQQFPDIFRTNDELRLKPQSMAYVVSQFQKYDFRKTPVDIKGAAFQAFVHAHSRGERGEFFTPHPILRLVVNILNPKDDESILDPACGSGGFLVETLKHVREQFEQVGLENFDLIDAVRSYAHTYIRGIDFNPDLARVSKMYMVLNDDGHTGIFSENSLENVTNWGQAKDKINLNSFDVLMTNPPFGSKGKVTDKKILGLYELGHKWRREDEKWQMDFEKLMSHGNGEGGQVPDILFVERCLEFLKNNGRMAIVLPDGDLTNSSLQYVREWVKNKARILAVVSLPAETFVPFGAGVKASVLFLQKLEPKELAALKKKDYPIFMAIIEKIGYDIRGRTVYRRDEKGKIIKDENDNPIVDEDVSEIIEEFRKFREKYKLEF